MPTATDTTTTPTITLAEYIRLSDELSAIRDEHLAVMDRSHPHRCSMEDARRGLKAATELNNKANALHDFLKAHRVDLGR